MTTDSAGGHSQKQLGWVDAAYTGANGIESIGDYKRRVDQRVHESSWCDKLHLDYSGMHEKDGIH